MRRAASTQNGRPPIRMTAREAGAGLERYVAARRFDLVVASIRNPENLTVFNCPNDPGETGLFPIEGGMSWVIVDELRQGMHLCPKVRRDNRLQFVHERLCVVVLRPCAVLHKPAECESCCFGFALCERERRQSERVEQEVAFACLRGEGRESHNLRPAQVRSSERHPVRQPRNRSAASLARFQSGVSPTVHSHTSARTPSAVY